MTYKSGNVCVDNMDTGEPCGINITITNYWANFTLIDDENWILYVMPVIELKQLIIDHKYIYLRYLRWNK